MPFRFAAQEALAAENRTVTFHGRLLGDNDGSTRTWSIAAPSRPKFSLEAGATDTDVTIRIPSPEGEFLGCVATASLTGGVFAARTAGVGYDLFQFTVVDASADIEISFQISYNIYPDR